MNTIKRTYEILTNNNLVENKKTFSVDWANRNENWFAHLESTERDCGLEALINILIEAQTQRDKFKQRRNTFGFIADEYIKALSEVIDIITDYLGSKYKIKSVELLAA